MKNNFDIVDIPEKKEKYTVINKMTFDATLEKDNFRQLFKDNIDQFKEAVKLAFREALPSLPPEFKIIDREIYLELKPPFLPPPSSYLTLVNQLRMTAGKLALILDI